MKRIIISSFVLIVTIWFANSQELKPVEKVPVVVSNKLDNLYPQRANVTWLTDGTKYIANFTLNGLNTRVLIAESGRWIETQQDYFLENCPRNMQKHLSQTFGEYTINSITRIDKPEKNEYVVSISKGNEQLTLHYDLSGKFLEDLQEKRINDASRDIPQSTNEKNQKKEMLPIHQKELPGNVLSYIMKNYPGYNIKESYIVNNETYRNAYHVILMNPAGDIYKLWFDFQGILINQESKEVLKTQNTAKQEGKKEVTSKAEKPSKKTKQAQHIPESKVPSAALSYFNSKVKKAENVYWDTIKKEYVVSYTDPTKNSKNRMHFDQTGKYLKSVTLLDKLPPQINTYIEKNYPKLEIYEAQSVVTADKKKYVLVYIYSPYWANDPMVYHELYFSTSGALLKEVLADYIDQDEEEYKKYLEEKETSFIDYVEQDDVQISDVNLVDGQPVRLKDLPTPVIKHLKANYPDYVFKGGLVVSENNQLLYSLLIKREGFKEKKRVFYDMKGNFVREENAY